MKRLVFSLMALLCVVTPALAQTTGGQSRGTTYDTGGMFPRQDGPYGSLSLNYSFTEESNSGPADIRRDNGFGAHAALGHSWQNWRAEAELGWMKSDADPTGDVRFLTGMGNVFYDFRNSSRWTPYIGGGLGLANVDLDRVGATGSAQQINDSETVLACQLMGGVSYALSQNTDLFGGYRYFRAEDIDSRNQAGQRINADFTNHIIETGVKIRF
jgi:opacity protein-like surface antigen